jgi:DNA-binding protein HU-beta
MNKGELVEAISSNAAISKKAADDALKSVTTNITKALKKGNKVSLTGFGTFSVQKRAARNGRNPKTGESIKIKARKVPKFSAGKELKEAVK